ncbi:MAG: sialate O-acetylesterase [Chloroflexota bacterium]
MSGIWLQRTYGAGDLLRAAGVLPPRTETMGRPTRTAVGLPAEFQGQVSLFVLAGQSNMSGWAPLPAEQTLHPRAFVFGNDYLWRLAQEPIDHPDGQVDLISLDRGSELPGTSPGLSFAATLLDERPELVIGLIPCAKGDTTLHEWQRSLSDDTLYGSCLKRIAAASMMGELAGILFFQGEADALDPVEYGDRPLSAHNYGERFTQFIYDLRRDLERPNLPLVFAQIGSQTAPEAFINWTVIQEQQAAVDLHCVAMITTRDLALHDGVHYTSESYQTIGARFADVYVELTNAQVCE